MRGTEYRHDIDGLRAIAVLSVVLYHAGVPGFGGGFVGVDVFFVISGYLITGIIVREIAQGRFSILEFYERRIRRIFPALFAMLSVACLAALIIQLPGELEEFAKGLIAAALFVSNIFFWQTADYFAGPSHLKPLLHTWSLAVEEQFYVVFPLMLMAIARWGAGRALLWLIPVTLVSLAISMWAAGAKPVAGFYLLPSRFWELMMGALLALGAVPHITHPRLRNAAGIAGLVLILAPVALYSTATAFPGHAALAPCLGAALLIHAGSSGVTLAGRLLSLRPLVFVGLLSYSLYLWHWPLLAFARQWNGETLSGIQIAALVAASFVLAAMSWRYVEQPFRGRRIAPDRRRLFAAGAAATIVSIAFAVAALHGGGWPVRHPGYAPPEIAGLKSLREGTCFLNESQGPEDWAGQEHCTHGAPGAPILLVWGDSYAAHLVPGLVAEAQGSYRIVQFTASGCPPVPGVKIANRPTCRAFNARALELISELRPHTILMSARWALYLPRTFAVEAVAETIGAVRGSASQLLLLAQSPNFDFAHPYDFVYRTGRDEARLSFPAQLNATMVRMAPAEVVDPLPVLCRGSNCAVRHGKSYLYFDDGHFSVAGSRVIAGAILARLAGQSELAEGRERTSGGDPGLGPVPQ